MLTKDVTENKEMKVEVQERLKYDNDIFFKFALGTEDEDAAFIRNTIIERVTGIHPKESTVLNPNLDPAILKKKKMVLDIRVKDSEGREYGIEMQTTYSKQSELKRFELYGARMLSNQLDSGERYYDLLPVYQIIFLDSYAEHTKKLIDAYQMRNEEGEVESKRSLMKRIYIYLPEINAIVKRKGFEKLNDFEQLCFLFKNNDEDGILKTEERLVKKVMEKYRKFQDAEDLWSIAMATQIQEQREKNAILDSFEDGVEQGIKQGIEQGVAQGIKQGQKEGERTLLNRLLVKKYHEDCSTWLCSLTMEQIDLVSNLLLTCDTLQELKNQLMGNK